MLARHHPTKNPHHAKIAGIALNQIAFSDCPSKHNMKLYPTSKY
jgi:hypothetical protein